MMKKKTILVSAAVFAVVAAVTVTFFVLRSRNAAGPPDVPTPGPVAGAYAPILVEIEPADGAVVRGADTWIRWNAPEAKGQVQWRKAGETDFRIVPAIAGDPMLSRLAPLTAGEMYEYVVESRIGDTIRRSGLRKFHVQGGLAFEPAAEQTIRRDYDQTVTLTLKNTSDQKVVVAARALVRFDDLPADVVGPGSVDQPAELEPGKSIILRLAVTAPDATRETYDIPVEAAGASVVAKVRITETNVKLAFRVVGEDPNTLAKSVEVRNDGDTLTNLSIQIADPNQREVRVSPGISHALLLSGDKWTMRAEPVLFLEFTGLKAELECRAAGKTLRFPLEFVVPAGKRLFGIRTGTGQNDRSGDWYCTNKPSTTTTIPAAHGQGPQPGPDDCKDAEQQAARLKRSYQRYMNDLDALRSRRGEMDPNDFAAQEAAIDFNLVQLWMQWEMLQEMCPISGDIGLPPPSGVPNTASPSASGSSRGGQQAVQVRPGLNEAIQARAAFSRQHRGPFAAPVDGNAADSSGSAAGYHSGDRVGFAWHRDNQVIVTSVGPDGKPMQPASVLGNGRWPRLAADGKRTAVAFQRGESFVARVDDGSGWGADIPLPGKDAAIAYASNGALHAATSTGLWKFGDKQFERVSETVYTRPALVVDDQGKPHVAWQQDGNIMFGDAVVDAGERPTLTIAADGTIYLAYLSKGALVWRMRKGGAWSQLETIEAKNPLSPTLARSGDGVNLSYIGAADRGPNALWLVRLPAKESILMPSLAGNVTDASLLVHFGLRSSRWNYRPHDVATLVNDVLVGTFTKKIPEGRYLFPLNPYQVVTSPGRPAVNRIAIRSKHTNGGSYTTSSDYQLITRTAWSEWFVFAADEAEARKALTSRPGLNHDRPDLAVLANSLDLPTESPKDAITTFAVTVANVGEAASAPTQLAMFSGERPLASVAIPALKPGERNVATLQLVGRVASVTFNLVQVMPDFDPKNDTLTLQLWPERDPSLTKDPVVRAGRGTAVGLDLVTWKQQGPKGNGNWELAKDGKSVLQTINGDPTYYVSPDEYIDVTLRGVLTVEAGGDDDYIGFVFGYKSPLTGEEDAPNDFLLFDWKGEPQDNCPEGFTLARVNGKLAKEEGLWDRQETDRFKILAKDHGAGKGWRHEKSYAFELIYQKDRVRIAIDGKSICDVKGVFPPGRFGFYNYSQAGIRYSDFTATQGESKPEAVAGGGVPLRDWKQQGPAANGKWVLSKDGTEVVVTEGKKPTFFVSPDDHIDTTLRFKIQRKGNWPWRQHVGIVLGYRSPVADKGDKDNQFEFLLLRWSGTRFLPGSDSLSLVRVKGNFDKSYDSLGDHKKTLECEPLAHNGEFDTLSAELAFEVRYEKDRIRVSVNGKPVLDVKGTFVPGRIGFYNHDEPTTHYYGFSVTTEVALRDWKQQGPAANGKWVLSKDGTEVVVTAGEKPTLFVSPDDHINTTIKCKIRVDPNEGGTPFWDHAGFVFGYRSPVADKGDKDGRFEFLLLKWSGVLSVPPSSGFYLVRVKGTFDKGYDKLSESENTPECELLATNSGPEGSSKRGVEHAFELRYEEDRIRITVDGKPLFDVKGKFAPGRFGFYNFGQPNVRYYGFIAQPNPAKPK